jgi:hypothetical protein
LEKGERVPVPPAPDAGEATEKTYGNKRAGLRLSERRVISPEWMMPRGPAISGFEHRGRLRPIAGTDDVEWSYVERLPRRWEASQLRQAYLAALRIVRRVGLSLSAYETWCWRDPGGGWWALPDMTGGDFSPGRAAELRGAWRLPGRGRTAEAQAWPPEIIESFGGPSGP